MVRIDCCAKGKKNFRFDGFGVPGTTLNEKHVNVDMTFDMSDTGKRNVVANENGRCTGFVLR
jgi:hypothetical protein